MRLVRCRLLPVTAALVVASAAAAQPDPDEPQWIWATARPADDQVCRFRRVFELDQPARLRRLAMACDNHFEAWLDGELLLDGDDWQQLSVASPALELAAGTHVLAVRGRNDGGPAALAGVLVLDLEDGGTRRLVTDDSWWALDGDDAWQELRTEAETWRRAHGFGVVSDPDGPWANPFAPRFATPAESLQLADGYVVELLHSAQPGEGSWIAMAFDPRGGLWLARERAGLLHVAVGEDGEDRVTLRPVDPEGVRHVQGMLWAHGSLWANVCRKNGGLYRLWDENGDRRFERIERVWSIDARGEHGCHGIALGPDGYVYVMHGNMTTLPATAAPWSAYRDFDEDQLLPRREDPSGHAVGIRAPAGHVLRVAPDASTVELYAGGFRNAYDLAFAPGGELFTVDADMEWDVGLPWYRPVRLCRVTSGAEFGWRSGSGKWPKHYPDSVPPVLELGRGSPTGVAFGTGSRFPARDAAGLFAADWTLGTIFLIRGLDSGGGEPPSSSGGGPPRSEPFVSGRPLNVTDLAFGPDGALWFITGGRSTQSGLYRISATADGMAAMAQPEVAPAVIRRRALESFHRNDDPAAVAMAWPYLGDADRFVAHAARVAIERRPVGEWRGLALAERQPRAALAALLALARLGQRRDLAPVLDCLLGMPVLDANLERVWLRVLNVALCRLGPPSDAHCARLRARLRPRFPTGDAVDDRELLATLLYLQADVAGDAVTLVEQATSRREQIAYAFPLRHADQGFAPEMRLRLARWLARTRRQRGGGNSFSGYLDEIRDGLLAAAEGTAVAASLQEILPEEDDAAKPSEPVPLGPVVRHWQMADLVPHLDEVGRGRSFDAGKQLFDQVLCATCHRFGEAGTGGIGPDLTLLGRRFGRQQILESILEPSKVVVDQYQSVVLRLRGGGDLVGRIVAESEQTLTVATDANLTERRDVATADVVGRTPLPVSTMPPALLDSLTREQILDLLAYLENEEDEDAAAFK